MEEIQSAFRKISEDTKQFAAAAMNSRVSAPPPAYSSSGTPASVLMTRPPRNMVSMWTCSKLCAVFFVGGVIVGYTLKRRVKRLASRLLKRLKDD